MLKPGQDNSSSFMRSSHSSHVLSTAGSSQHQLKCDNCDRNRRFLAPTDEASVEEKDQQQQAVVAKCLDCSAHLCSNCVLDHQLSAQYSTHQLVPVSAAAANVVQNFVPKHNPFQHTHNALHIQHNQHHQNAAAHYNANNNSNYAPPPHSQAQQQQQQSLDEHQMFIKKRIQQQQQQQQQQHHQQQQQLAVAPPSLSVGGIQQASSSATTSAASHARLVQIEAEIQKTYNFYVQMLKERRDYLVTELNTIVQYAIANHTQNYNKQFKLKLELEQKKQTLEVAEAVAAVMEKTSPNSGPNSKSSIARDKNNNKISASLAELNSLALVNNQILLTLKNSNPLASVEFVSNFSAIQTSIRNTFGYIRINNQFNVQQPPPNSQQQQQQQPQQQQQLAKDSSSAAIYDYLASLNMAKHQQQQQQGGFSSSSSSEFGAFQKQQQQTSSLLGGGSGYSNPNGGLEQQSSGHNNYAANPLIINTLTSSSSSAAASSGSSCHSAFSSSSNASSLSSSGSSTSSFKKSLFSGGNNAALNATTDPQSQQQHIDQLASSGAEVKELSSAWPLSAASCGVSATVNSHEYGSLMSSGDLSSYGGIGTIASADQKASGWSSMAVAKPNSTLSQQMCSSSSLTNAADANDTSSGNEDDAKSSSSSSSTETARCAAVFTPPHVASVVNNNGAMTPVMNGVGPLSPSSASASCRSGQQSTAEAIESAIASVHKQLCGAENGSGSANSIASILADNERSIAMGDFLTKLNSDNEDSLSTSSLSNSGNGTTSSAKTAGLMYSRLLRQQQQQMHSNGEGDESGAPQSNTSTPSSNSSELSMHYQDLNNYMMLNLANQLKVATGNSGPINKLGAIEHPAWADHVSLQHQHHLQTMSSASSSAMIASLTASASSTSSSSSASSNVSHTNATRTLLKRAKMIYHCKFGEFGINDGQFTEPSGVTINSENDIIVADTNSHRIQIFDREGRFKFKFGECGKRDGQLLYPNRVAVVRQTGEIVVTERSPTHQIQVYNKYGQFVRKFGANILQHPRGVCVDIKGRIIVVECKVMRVIIFDLFGNVLHKFNCSKYLEFPNGVCCSSNEREEIYISDNRAHCIKVFDYAGNFIRQIGGEGITNYPIGVGINANNEILVADNHNNFNLTVFTQDGQLINSLESKVKHAQCFDVGLMDDGSIVLASKDYRIYVYNHNNIEADQSQSSGSNSFDLFSPSKLGVSSTATSALAAIAANLDCSLGNGSGMLGNGSGANGFIDSMNVF